MATVNDRELVDRLIANNGHYEANWRDDPTADPPVLSITEYTNDWGGTSYGLCYPADPPDKYAASLFVHQPKILFQHLAHSDCNSPAGRP